MLAAGLGPDMKFLFVKQSLGWPRAAGHDVHGYYMMRALSAAGHGVALATVNVPADAALKGAGLEATYVLDKVGRSDHPTTETRFQERFRRYYGIEPTHIAAVRDLARDVHADATVAVGLEVLPYLASVTRALRVWYAADEWLWHHLSQIRLGNPRSWHHVRDGLIKGLYERAYHRVVDVTWVVTEVDRRAMELVGGMRDVAVIPNGVDADFYQPQAAPEIPNSAVFWGRLDFGPNVDALTWFCRDIWPFVRRRQPDGRLTIIGYEPSPAIRRLAGRDGIELKANVDDLPSEACRHGVAILPFVSGGGIKNKLLEAAALSRAIVCSPVAARGLQHGPTSPFTVATNRTDWMEALLRLWANDQLRRERGRSARQWVIAYHNWPAAATKAVDSLTTHRGQP